MSILSLKEITECVKNFGSENTEIAVKLFYRQLNDKSTIQTANTSVQKIQKQNGSYPAGYYLVKASNDIGDCYYWLFGYNGSHPKTFGYQFSTPVTVKHCYRKNKNILNAISTLEKGNVKFDIEYYWGAEQDAKALRLHCSEIYRNFIPTKVMMRE